MTLRESFNRWLAYNAAALKGSTAQSRRYSAERFFEWCEDHQVGFESIDRSHIAAFMRWCQEMELKNNTIKMRLKELRAFFEWCVEERLLPLNPVQMKHLPRLKSELPNKVPFMFDEWQQAMTEARRLDDDGQEPIYSEFWPSAMTVGYHTGLRISDVALSRWVNVDFDGDLFIIYPKKKETVRERLEIPLVTELREHLLTLWAARDDGSDYILPAMAITYLGARTKLEGEFRTICDEAGLHGHSYHSFRHGLVSRLINSGVDAIIISKITGQTIETIGGYAHISNDAKRSAMEGIGREIHPRAAIL